MTLGTLSWVYKTSDYLRVIGPGSSCWSYQYGQLKPSCVEASLCPVEADAYWTRWVIVILFTANGTSCQEIKTHCDCQAARHTSVCDAKLHSATVHRAAGQVMVPDPPLGPKDARPALKLRLRKINNKPAEVSLAHWSTRFLQFHFEQPKIQCSYKLRTWEGNSP